MRDKIQDRKDVLEMRKLFHDKVEGKITHEELTEEIDRINNRQLVLEEVGK